MNYVGSIIGDYCGSIYEFNNVRKNVPHYSIDILNNGHFTDDTICTVAVMEWLCTSENKDPKVLIDLFRKWGRKYPNVGFGPKFKRWLYMEGYNPTDSFGNGAAMRVSPCAYYANTIDECLELAEISAKSTHGHEEAVKGAKAVAEAIYLARSGAGKEDIVNVISADFGYDLNKPINEIGTAAHDFDATCQVTVPEALICFANSNSFTDCIRLSIWVGGDSDTIAAMSGGIAEAYYGIPHCIIEDFKNKFPEDIKRVVSDFNKCIIDS